MLSFDSSDFEPLRVTARLRTGVVSDQWLPLDGVLMYQVYRDRFGPQDATLPGGGIVEELGPEAVPLEIRNPGTPFWYYACSFAQPQPWWVVEGQDHWNKKFRAMFADLIDFGGRRGKVIIEQGKYRSYHMPIFYRVALQVEWYCVGHKEAIEYLLKTVTHVGKKRSQGWGRVSEWVVESWPVDCSIWKDGKLMRAVPVEDVDSEGVDVMNYGLRPPYYMRQNQMMVVKPCVGRR